MAEYRELREELRTYIREFSPKLTVLGTFIATVFTFFCKVKSDGVPTTAEWDWLAVMMLPAILLLSAITTGQAFLISALGSRVRLIEQEIAWRNGATGPDDERFLLRWESHYAARYVYRPWVVLMSRSPLPNPLIVSVVCVVLAGLAMIGYVSAQAVPFLFSKSAIAGSLYAVICSVAALLQVMSVFTFYQLGRRAEEDVKGFWHKVSAGRVPAASFERGE